MNTKRHAKLNRLHRLLPEGLLADARWFNAHGYPSNLRARYVAAGWLEKVGPSVYRRPLFKAGFEDVPVALHWKHVVVSLQLVMGYPLAISGETALTLQDHAHSSPTGGLEHIGLRTVGRRRSGSLGMEAAPVSNTRY